MAADRRPRTEQKRAGKRVERHQAPSRTLQGVVSVQGVPNCHRGSSFDPGATMSFFATPGLSFVAGAGAGAGASGSADSSFAASAQTAAASAQAAAFVEDPHESSSSSPGLFTEEDEENERRSATLEEMVGSRADFYGTVVVRDRPAAEVRAALNEMDEELRLMPPSRRRRYDEAREKCPDQVSDEKKEAFLWRMDFDAKLAAERLVRYWEFKHSIFGEEKCYLPLTLCGALRDDIGTISAGILELVPVKDSCGRSMVFFEPSRRDISKHSKESVLRAMWYVYHAALEDPEVKKRGIVWLAYVEKSTPRHFDIQLYPKIMDLEGRYVPILTRAFHICHPDPFFRAISPIAKHILGQRIRKRTGVHWGTKLEVLEKLIDFGIPPDRVPTAMGGGLVMDTTNWLCDRLSLEKERVAAEVKKNAGELAAAAALKVYQQSLNEERYMKRRRDDEDDQSKSLCGLPSPTSLAAEMIEEQQRIGLQSSPLAVATCAPEPRKDVLQLQANSLTTSASNESAASCPSVLYHSMLRGTLRPLQSLADGAYTRQTAISTLSSVNSPTMDVSSNDAFLSQLLLARPGTENGSLAMTGTSLLNANKAHAVQAETPNIAVLQQLLQKTHCHSPGSGPLRNFGYLPASAGSVPSAVSPNPTLPPIPVSTSLPLPQQPPSTLSPLLRTSQNLDVLQQQALHHTLALSASSSRAMATKPPPSDCRILYIPDDEDKISSHQCLIRKQIEAFVATEEHVTSHARGRNKPITLGQVGIRCRHCRGLPLESNQRGSIYFPATLLHLYQAAVNMAGFHLTNPETCCRSMPQDVKDEFLRSKPSKSTVGGGKKYWANAGRAIGLVETEQGLRFDR